MDPSNGQFKMRWYAALMTLFFGVAVRLRAKKLVRWTSIYEDFPLRSHNGSNIPWLYY